MGTRLQWDKKAVLSDDVDVTDIDQEERGRCSTLSGF